ncbi:MAG: DUF1553 domain-containing protein [Verrucomicrobiota bacterium]
MLVLTLPVFGESDQRELSFANDVRPILSDKCFKCHGPDARNQKSSFRIDSFEQATEDLGGVAGVVPGDLKRSEVHWRIHSPDEDEVMPPPGAKMALSPREKEILDQWIQAGAVYEQHWAFKPLPGEVEVPRSEGSRARGEIDRFLFGRLAEEGVDPSPESPPETWLRRVTLDLTGLPPTFQELDAFLADPSEEARSRIVDDLFERVSFAERMASEWLDAARYADTYGYQVDRDRFVWPWRDWVVQSFASNLSYDQFLTWQLAGDLLPGATRDQQLATAFNRLHPQKVEGGSVEEEFRIEYISDRVNTVGTVFLGLTMECTKCHDHKYDPLTQNDYFSLSAFFANLDEAGLYSFFDSSAVPTPALSLPTDAQHEALIVAEKEEQVMETSLLRSMERAERDFEDWGAGKDRESTLLAEGEVFHLDFDTPGNGGFLNVAKTDQEKRLAKSAEANQSVAGWKGKGLLLTGDHAVELPEGVGNFTRNEPFSFALWVQIPKRFERAVLVRRSKAWTDAASRGIELLLEEGRLSGALIHFWPGNAIRVRSLEEIPIQTWQHLAFSYDGSSRARGLKLYLNGTEVEVEVVRDGLTRQITDGQSKSMGLAQRMRDRGFKGGVVDEFRLFDRQLSRMEIRELAGIEQESSGEDWLDHYRLVHHAGVRETRERLQAAREKRAKAQQAIPQIMTMREFPGEARQSFVLNRGLYSDRGEEVGPGTPEVLPPLETDSEGRASRLDLAQWLTAPEHPLTARVTVNRYWQMLFGRGLVVTSEDFGSQGSPPSHPELLDWLARDFVNSGWSVRGLLKKIVLSAAYRQESHRRHGLDELDPENVLLARGPTVKLTAEMIRDQALAISGLLSPSVGGAPVKPYDIEFSFSKKPLASDTGPALYRRSLYTYWKRTGPSPLMMTLDAAKRDVCSVRREKTTSPLQSLVLLNAPQFVEAARVGGERLLETAGNERDLLVRDAFRLLTSRLPSDPEHRILRQLWDEQYRFYLENPHEAQK